MSAPQGPPGPEAIARNGDSSLSNTLRACGRIKDIMFFKTHFVKKSPFHAPLSRGERTAPRTTLSRQELQRIVADIIG